MDDEFIYKELQTISANQSRIESLVSGLKENMDRMCAWKDDVLPTLQTCKDYMEKRADLPDKIVNVEKYQDKLKERIDHDEELNSASRKDVKFIMTWYFKIAGAIGILIVINTILVLIKNLSDIRGGL
jgi:hypothetical protein